jgi:hypothetical protein
MLVTFLTISTVRIPYQVMMTLQPEVVVSNSRETALEN